ncbi:MAG: hypothetical protein SNJ68_03920 [Cyanobacteriota bacterium]
MPYDNICKTLVELNPLPFVRWLVGDPTEPIQILKTELTVEPIRADFVSFLQVGSQILHLEFQTDPDPNMPLRMLDYYVRLRRQYQCQILQVVLFLRQTQSQWVTVDQFVSQTTWHQYRVFRLWEVRAEQLLGESHLWPLAVLAFSDPPVAILREVACRIQALENHR